MGAIAEYDRAMLTARMRVGRERKRAKEGRCEGRKPYGTRPGEQAVIECMFAIYGTGVGMCRP
jgi:hypothetical protein